MILDATGGQHKVAQEILFHGQLRLRRPVYQLGAAIHECDAPDPEWDRLAHVTDADLESRKMIEHSRGHHANHMSAYFNAVTPHRGIHAVVLQGPLEGIRCGPWMNVDAGISASAASSTGQ